MVLPSLRPDPLLVAASARARPLPAARVSAASNSATALLHGRGRPPRHARGRVRRRLLRCGAGPRTSASTDPSLDWWSLTLQQMLLCISVKSDSTCTSGKSDHLLLKIRQIGGGMREKQVYHQWQGWSYHQWQRRQSAISADKGVSSETSSSTRAKAIGAACSCTATCAAILIGQAATLYWLRMIWLLQQLQVSKLM
ncbi:hypothetical protein ACQJBY_048832 [Aegilops geniculata]